MSRTQESPRRTLRLKSVLMKQMSIALPIAVLISVLIATIIALSTAPRVAFALPPQPPGSATQAPPSSPWAALYRKSLPSVVYILSEGICTGAFVGPDTVLTAWHCVNSSRNIQVGFTNDKRKLGLFDFPFGVKVIAKNEQADLALLRLPTAHNQPFLSLPKNTERESVYAVGDEVGTIGHPYSLSPFAATGLNESQLFILTTGKTAKLAEDLIVADMLVLPGNSGGPVLNRQGQLVGVVSARHRSGDLCYFSEVSKIRQLLNDAQKNAVSTDVRSRKMFEGEAVAFYGLYNSNRLAAQKFKGKQNYYVLQPTVTFYRHLELSYLLQVGQSNAMQRALGVQFVNQLQFTPLIDAQFGAGLQRSQYDVDYTDESGSSHKTKRLYLEGTASFSLLGFRMAASLPFSQTSYPGFSVGLNLFELLPIL